MGSHTFHHHTADVRMQVEGDNLEDLFLSAAEGMNTIMRAQAITGEAVHAVIELSAPDSTALLIDFLSEVLTLSHIRKAVFDQIELDRLETDSLRARLTGQPIEDFGEDVKAVTYHEAEVIQGQDGKWSTMVIFDI
jgi:SHS2 domain-containing protein